MLALLVVPRAAPGPVATSPTPSATRTSAASASPTPPSATATVAATGTGDPLAAGYGYIVIGGGGLAVVDESGKTIQQHACGVPSRGCGQQLVAVSPDGRRVAFWRAAQGSRWEVATFDAAMPATVRGVATLPEGMEGQAVLWAADSRGLLFTAQTEGYGGIRGGAGKATISAIDVTTAAPAGDVMPARTDGFFYVPVAWDRQRNVVAAGLTGEGGFLVEYAASVGGRYSASKPPGEMGAFALAASPDATRVLSFDRSANMWRIWPVDDISKQVTVSPGPNAGGNTGARWRTASDVAWTSGPELGVFVPQTNASRTVYTASSGNVRLVALRPDGTGALVSSGGQINVSVALIVVDLGTGAVTAHPAMDVAQVVVPRGVLLR